MVRTSFGQNQQIEFVTNTTSVQEDNSTTTTIIGGIVTITRSICLQAVIPPVAIQISIYSLAT